MFCVRLEQWFPIGVHRESVGEPPSIGLSVFLKMLITKGDSDNHILPCWGASQFFLAFKGAVRFKMLTNTALSIKSCVNVFRLYHVNQVSNMKLYWPLHTFISIWVILPPHKKIVKKLTLAESCHQWLRIIIRTKWEKTDQKDYFNDKKIVLFTNIVTSDSQSWHGFS